MSRSPSPQRGPAQDDMDTVDETNDRTAIQVGDEVNLFAEELDRHNTELKSSPAEKRAQVFKLVESYCSYTRRRVDHLRERQLHRRSGRQGSWQHGASNDMDIDETDDGKSTIGSEELQKAEEEAQTWDLLRRVLPLRYRDSITPQHRTPTASSAQSRSQWWNDFLITDSTARERKVVLEWLQSNASHGPPIDEVVSELQENAERGDILAHGWLHTRHKIKLQKSVNGYQGVIDPNAAGLAESHLGSNTLITQLDPDALTRQQRKLENQDDFFERAIWLGCFAMLRRGCSMAEIREWCSVRTELWRAASLSPLPLANSEDEDQPDFDPSSLVLWRRMCYANARDGGTSDYDKAVYGLLAGDISSVEKVCKSWDDFLFAHYNALLRTQFDSFLIKHGGEAIGKAAQKFPVFNAVVHHGDPMSVSKKLVASFETDMRTKDEALRTLKALQGAIVANELDRFMCDQGLVLAKQANQKHKSRLIPASVLPLPKHQDKYFDLADHDSMRVLAHVLIVVSTLDRLSGFLGDQNAMQPRHQAQENIIAAYVSFLRLAHLQEMIPLYCSKLHGSRVYECLSRNLIQIEDEEKRLHQIALMKNLGLDVEAFARALPNIFLGDVNDLALKCEAKGKFKILEDGAPTLKYGRIVKPDFFGDDGDFVDSEDDLIIRSMEWLLLVPALFKETCEYAIRTYKYFLKSMRLRAARALSERVSGRAIIEQKTSLPLRGLEEDSGPGWFEDFTAVELPDDLLRESNTSAEELTNTVRNMWELECLVRALDSMETLSSLAGITREENSSSREMWQHTSQEVRKAKACMQPVLRNWLQITNRVDRDFDDLREAYIPETVLAYVSSLHFAGTSLSRDNLLECMELAAIIAEKGSDVAQQFQKGGRMKELVESFASCSKALAIWTSDKKNPQTNSKKMREMGWSRELWSVKP